MAFATPTIDQMFDGLPREQRLERFEAYKSALSRAQARSIEAVRSGAVAWNGKEIVKGASLSETSVAELSKAYSPEIVADVQAALNKDWSLTNPLNTVPYGNIGLVPYDLDEALAMLVPRSFILRNSTPRIKGVGQAYEYRRILGVSNSGTGGVPNLNTFFNPSSQTAQFPAGGLSLNRPAKISYAADRKVLSHVNQGVSDSVDMTAFFAGQGYTDLRQLSHTSAIWSHMLGEERNMANSRSTALAAPTGTGSAAASATVTSGSGLPAISGASAVVVTALSSVGESQAVSCGNISSLTAGYGITISGLTAAQGSLGYAVYVTISSTTYRGFTTRIDGASPTTFVAVAAAPSTSADNGSFNANGYDGYVSTLTSSASGYVKSLNGSLSTSEPGAEFQDAFASLFNNVIGDPDVIITTAAIRRSLAKAFQNGSANGYRLNYSVGSDGATVGSVIDAVQNESTGKMLDVIAHPYLAPGTALIHSKTLPFPDSGVAETVQVVNVQDMIVVEWPQIQMSWDLSTYQYGNIAFRAPAWSAAVTNIVA